MRDLLYPLLVILYFSNASSEIRDPCHLVPDKKLINDPSSCDAYFQCDHGKSKPKKCNSGEWFNLRTGDCDLASNVVCRNKTETNPCKGIEDGKFVRDPKSCSSYFWCNNEKATPDQCNDGLHFDEISQSCIYRERSKCNENESGNDPANSVCINIPDGLNIRNEYSCEEFWICSNEKALISKCLNNKYFNQRTAACDERKNVICEPIVSCRDIKDGSFIRDYKNCSGWYQCIDGEPMQGECPKGLWFVNDGKTQRCDYKYNVNELECPNRCQDEVNQWVPKHGTKCFSYYHCKNGQINGAAAECGEKTRFNFEKQGCDDESNVDPVTCKTK